MTKTILKLDDCVAEVELVVRCRPAPSRNTIHLSFAFPKGAVDSMNPNISVSLVMTPGSPNSGVLTVQEFDPSGNPVPLTVPVSFSGGNDGIINFSPSGGGNVGDANATADVSAAGVGSSTVSVSAVTPGSAVFTVSAGPSSNTIGLTFTPNP